MPVMVNILLQLRSLKFGHFGLVLLYAMVGSGCSTIEEAEVVLGESQQQKAWETQQTKLSSLTRWILDGRLGIKVPGESGTMSLEWRQEENDYTLYLDGPLGQSIAKITGSPEGVVVETSGEKYKGVTPEALLFEITGWDLPVSLLRYWVIGLPAPGQNLNIKLNRQGYAELISQQGWEVQYLSYKDFKGIQMPSRMKVVQGEVRLVLSIRNRLVMEQPLK